MLLGLCLICVTLVGWGVVATVTKPAGHASRQRDLDRRLRHLERHPEWVNLHDVENLMLAESIPSATVARVLARASSRLSARTMWRWAEAFGTGRLVMVVDAGVAEDTLLDHLDAGTAPDWTEMTVFAGLANDTIPAGIPLDELVDLDAVPAIEDLTFHDLANWETEAPGSPDPAELRRFDHLPPIAGPGFAPFRPIAMWDDELRGGREGQVGGDDWTSAA